MLHWFARIHFIKSPILIFIVGVFSQASLASPWVSVGDQRVFHQLTLLNDAGVIDVSLTTWPLMWSDIKLELDALDWTALNEIQRTAARELQFEMRYQTRQGVKKRVKVHTGDSRSLLEGFEQKPIEQHGLTQVLDWDGEQWAAQLQTNITSEPGDDEFETQWDGSYVAYATDYWVMGAGAIDRWWGPGYQSSLILGASARPVPALLLRTKGEQTFQSEWLSWLGPWQFVSFVGQLESGRVISEAKLTGMRFTFKPHAQLELGLSRAMQWGGEGRSQNLSAFWKSLTSQNENSGSGSGNQLGGFDGRLSFHLFDALPSAIYAQAIGEDEAGYMPSKYSAQFGASSIVPLDADDGSLRLFAEYNNSIAGALGTEDFNTAYEHSVYASGYRFRDRPLGASFDNDSKVLTLGAGWFRPDGDVYSLRVSDMSLNEDGVARGNVISRSAIDVEYYEASYQSYVIEGRLQLSVSYLSDELSNTKPDIDQAALSASWEYRF